MQEGGALIALLGAGSPKCGVALGEPPGSAFAPNRTHSLSCIKSAVADSGIVWSMDAVLR